MKFMLKMHNYNVKFKQSRSREETNKTSAQDDKWGMNSRATKNICTL